MIPDVFEDTPAPDAPDAPLPGDDGDRDAQDAEDDLGFMDEIKLMPSELFGCGTPYYPGWRW